MARNAGVPDPASPPPTEAQAAAYDRLVPMLEAAHREMTELSKKKQDGVVNSLKIKMINRLLTELSSVLEKDPSHGFVDLLDEDMLPQNSDVVLVLSQWQAALKQYKTRHYGLDMSIHEHRWFTVENPRDPDRF
ncbi:hypothetical protein Q5425_03095 [Amycolatopsis sp. A133]|uniref:hypothetical protein n=1 Tax=Amycolatopsis sp. A133 TaxID=3064472 RepID=UPI0027F4CA1A|nr:hypothetical protein [Amycolatopsis sp. A133]MDQ7802700.1 hypothetical protein [Amycolatopsis sp. A133]